MSASERAEHAGRLYVLPPTRAPHDYSAYARLVNWVKKLYANLAGAESHHIPASQLGFTAEEVPDACKGVANALQRLEMQIPDKRAWRRFYRPNVWASTLAQDTRDIPSYQDSVMQVLNSLASVLKRRPLDEPHGTPDGKVEVEIVLGYLTDLLEDIANSFFLLRYAVEDIEIFARRRGVKPDAAARQPIEALLDFVGPEGQRNWRKLDHIYRGGHETYQRTLLDAAYRTRAALVLVATVDLPHRSVSSFVAEECSKMAKIWTQGVDTYTEDSQQHSLAHRSAFPAYSRKNRIYGCAA